RLLMNGKVPAALEYGESRMLQRAQDTAAPGERDQPVVAAPDEQRRLGELGERLAAGGDRADQRARDGAREARVVLGDEALDEDATPLLAGGERRIVDAARERPRERDAQHGRARR